MKKNILIIEDDEFFRELITKKLFSDGFKVTEAGDGKKGILKVKESKPDLILLDLLLPDIDGFEVLSTVKEDSETASIPVVILSNLSSKEDIEKGLKLGASDFLIKSQVASDEITDKIKSFL
jgi:DNA-binding response OmpR family regulator